MLTWAVTLLILRGKASAGLGLLITVGCDTAIIYWIAHAIAGCRL